MNAADLILKMTEAGASSAVIAVVVSAIKKTSGNLPEFSGMSPEKEREIWKKVEAERKRNKYKPRRKNKAEAEANDAALPTQARAEKSPEKCKSDASGDCLLLTPLSTNSEEKLSKKEGKKRGEDTRARGTRLYEGMPLPDDFRKFALSEGVADPDALWVEFVDYWIAVPGQRGTKLNWFSTWRNRVRTVASRGKKHGYRNGAAAPRTELQSALDKAREFARGGDHARDPVSDN